MPPFHNRGVNKNGLRVGNPFFEARRLFLFLACLLLAGLLAIGFFGAGLL